MHVENESMFVLSLVISFRVYLITVHHLILWGMGGGERDGGGYLLFLRVGKGFIQKPQTLLEGRRGLKAEEEDVRSVGGLMVDYL